MAGKGRELEGALEVRVGMQREQKGGWGHWEVDEGALQGLRGTWRVPWSMGKVRAGMQRKQKGGWGHWGGAEERLMQMEAFFKLTSSPQHTSASLRVNFQKQTKTTKTIPRLYPGVWRLGRSNLNWGRELEEGGGAGVRVVEAGGGVGALGRG